MPKAINCIALFNANMLSKYALSKDESGKYIYDETIAEAFHDVYLNDDKASLPSKYIMRILKKYVEA